MYYLITCDKDRSLCTVEDYEIVGDPEQPPVLDEQVEFFYGKEKFTGTVVGISENENLLNEKAKQIKRKRKASNSPVKSSPLPLKRPRKPKKSFSFTEEANNSINEMKNKPEKKKQEIQTKNLENQVKSKIFGVKKDLRAETSKQLSAVQTPVANSSAISPTKEELKMMLERQNKILASYQSPLSQRSGISRVLQKRGESDSEDSEEGTSSASDDDNKFCKESKKETIKKDDKKDDNQLGSNKERIGTEDDQTVNPQLWGKKCGEPLLWAFVMAISVWGVVNISMAQWQRYNENPTVVTLAKDFRAWRIHMPAVTACEQNRVNPKKLSPAIKSRWNIDPGDPKYEYYSRFVTAVASSSLENLSLYAEFGDDPSLDVDFFELAVDVMVESRVKVGYSEGLKANWTPVMTELGVCHTFNSVAIADIAIIKPNVNDTTSSSSPITCPYTPKSCYFLLECVAVIDYYIHSPYDVADYTEYKTNSYPPLTAFVVFSTTETGVGPGVRELLPKRRHCLFTDEPTITSRKVYSTHSCRQECRRQLAIQLCDCQPFYYFYEKSSSPTCSVRGMRCLAAHQHRLSTLDTHCACSQHCLDAVFRENRERDQFMDGGPFSATGSVRYTLIQLQPRERYIRYIVFHFQDLVVSFGGATGLFLGASFISFVEIGYFLLERALRLPLTQNTRAVEVKKTSAPYEARIRELTAIIDKHF